MQSGSTAAQRLASDPARSAWVSANAGTGKTTVLVNRVLRLMLDGVPPRKILCITFTNAAAAEMRRRIVDTLSEWAIAPNEMLKEKLQMLMGITPTNKAMNLAQELFTKVVDHPSDLRIQTIHSLCQSLLGRFPLEAKVPPHFRVIDEQTSREILEEARSKLLSDASGREDKTLAKALHTIGFSIHEGEWRNCLHELTRERQRFTALLQNGTEALITRIYNTLDVTRHDTEIAYIRYACAEGAFDAHTLRRAVTILLEGNQTDKKNGAIIAAWLNATLEQRTHTFQDYCRAFLTVEQEAKSKLAGKEAEKLFPGVISILRQEQYRLLKVQACLRAIRTAKLSEALIHCGEAILTFYSDLKWQNAFLDYEDLILKSHTLLNAPGISPWIMYKLDEGIDHIVLDEAQDTSPQQWEIITSLCGDFFAGESRESNKRTFFAVGDEKQSIFSFQGADPRVFHAMKSYFKNQISNAKHGFESVALETSYRSTGAILEAVDAIFSDPTLRKAISTTQSDIRHQVHRMEAPGLVEVWPLVSKPEKKKTTPWPLPTERRQSQSAQQILATSLARTINEWLDNKRLLPSKGRPVQEGDIMILLQQRSSGFMNTLVKTLTQHGIRVAGIDRLALTNHIAIEDLIALAEFLLLPENDLSLAALLKSPLINLSEDDLFLLAYNRGKETLWNRLRQNSTYRSVYIHLSGLLNMADFVPPFELFSHVLDVRGGRKRFIERMGYEVNDPLNEFLNHALLYEHNHIPSLQGFLRWLKGSEEIIVKRDLEQGRNQVRVMTVHGAKGLQAPIVFLPDTMQMPQSTPALLWSDEHRLLLWPGKKENHTPLCKTIVQEEKLAQDREYLRLLYVALTRAEDELYICGYETGKNARKESWYDAITRQLAIIAEKAVMTLPGAENYQESIDGLRLASGTPVTKFSSKVMGTKERITPLPAYFSTPLSSDSHVSNFLVPSRAEEEGVSAFSPLGHAQMLRKGVLVHTLLEKLPNFPIEERAATAERLLSHLAPDLPLPTRKDLIREVLAVLSDNRIAAYFGPESRAEIPIVGKIGSTFISGQVDRLAVTENKILILDYKTGFMPREVPIGYLRQMAAYRALLHEIYPAKAIHCALLWTSETKLTALEDALLDKHTPASS